MIDYMQYEGHTPGPWMLCTGCSWRRFMTADQRTYVARPTIASDGHPDMSFNNPADARLMADAPMLLAECKRLDVGLGHLDSLHIDSLIKNKQLRAALLDVELCPAEAVDIARAALKDNP